MLGYQTVTSLSTAAHPPPFEIEKSSQVALPVHGKPFTLVGKERDSLRQKRRAKEHNKTAIVYAWIQTPNFTVQCGNR